MIKTRPLALAIIVALSAITVTSTAVRASTRPAQPAGKTASQFYLDYRVAFAKAKTINDLIPYMSQATRAQIESTPADQRAQMFEMVKMMGALTQVKVVKEAQTANGVTLTVEALDSDKKKTTGKIEIVKEEGAWKVGQESWSSSS